LLSAVRRFFQHRTQSNLKQRRTHWRTNIPVPITVRCRPAGKGADHFTANRWNRLYAHYPGLIVMTPVTVEDAHHVD
jgi:pyruvate dehydrogenase E1 component beta subunit/2-oxoisovalerate dehydrogenase E1 component beta subunit